MAISSIKGIAGFSYQGLRPGHWKQIQVPCANPWELCLKRQEVCKSCPSSFTAALRWFLGPLQQQVVVNLGGCGLSFACAQVLLLDAMCSGILWTKLQHSREIWRNEASGMPMGQLCCRTGLLQLCWCPYQYNKRGLLWYHHPDWSFCLAGLALDMRNLATMNQSLRFQLEAIPGWWEFGVEVLGNPDGTIPIFSVISRFILLNL